MISLLLAAVISVPAYLRAFVSAQNDVTIIGTTLSPTTATFKDTSAATGKTGTSTMRTPATMTITVNKVKDKFVPESLAAKVGDIVKFEFWPTNNSVARSDFAYPCIPYALTSASRAGLGFWSGFQPIVANLAQVNVSQLPAFYMVINRVTPLWFYNSAPGACIDHQMVGVINPADPSQLSLQKRAAAAATLGLSPGEPIPQSFSVSSFTAAATSISITTSTPTSSSPPSRNASASSGAIAGIVIGCVAAFALAGMAIWALRHARKRIKKSNEDKSGAPRPLSSEPDLTSLGATPRSPVTPQTAVSELPARTDHGTIDGVLGSAGRHWRGGGSYGGGGRPDSSGKYVVSPPWTPEGRSAVFEPWVQEVGGGGTLRVVSELSAYGELRKDQVPSTPPDKKLPQLPEGSKEKGPYELGP
ncbi:hypothetical protein B0J12DRAFT_289511 [Macrophomina phaseolina]|uniref:Uncharacterized protein n=1 Tax=Macrophomina phaseolina TaxID=35725 RepID=A0ABQ8GNH2_9PEZI|nr:hypothetical protein B0J12DRAFT_289511 [Macrophomina phaseolina]